MTAPYGTFNKICSAVLRAVVIASGVFGVFASIAADRFFVWVLWGATLFAVTAGFLWVRRTPVVMNWVNALALVCAIFANELIFHAPEIYLALVCVALACVFLPPLVRLATAMSQARLG